MWPMIASLQPLVQALAPAFSEPCFRTHCQLLLGWVLCLGQHRLCRVADTAHPERLRDHSQRHGLDTAYNFFERSAWTPKALAYRLAVLALTRLKLFGALTLLVDDTLTHKRGKKVWGLGWFRDAVASTRKRVATASGHNWVVLAVASACRAPASRSWPCRCWPVCTCPARPSAAAPNWRGCFSPRYWAGSPTGTLSSSGTELTPASVCSGPWTRA